MTQSSEQVWNDTSVSSWNELQLQLHSPDLIPILNNTGGHRRAPYLFRGMSVASWPLMTSLERLGSQIEKVEQPALRAFGKYAPIGTVSLESEWNRLAVAQHNGLPTRVLDWTGSPLIAAHFATVEADYRNGPMAADGIIWCVNADIVRKNIVPPKMRKELRDAKAVVYNVPLLDSLYPKLKDFNNTVDESGDIMIFFEPPSIDARIQNQYGLLSAMNSPSGSHHEYLWGHSRMHPKLVRRIIIKQSAKAEIRDMLDQNNITERMLFPGLPGLCDWLRRYYGPV